MEEQIDNLSVCTHHTSYTSLLSSSLYHTAALSSQLSVNSDSTGPDRRQQQASWDYGREGRPVHKTKTKATQAHDETDDSCFPVQQSFTKTVHSNLTQT